MYYLLTIIDTPYYTSDHICHSKVFMDLEDGAMAWVDGKDPEKRKLWYPRSPYGNRRWIYCKANENSFGDVTHYAIEEVSEDDLKPCDVLKQMEMDI